MYCFFTIPQEKITVSNILIIGNNVTKAEIILRELTFSKNSSFTTKELNEVIEKSKQNLINLKLFNFVEILTQIDDNNVKIVIDVTERWYFWPYPILEVSERNFNSWWSEFSSSNYSDFSRLNYGVFSIGKILEGGMSFYYSKSEKDLKSIIYFLIRSHTSIKKKQSE